MTGAQGEKRAMELSGARAKAGLAATAGPVTIREPGRILIPLIPYGEHLEWPVHWLATLARLLPSDTVILRIENDPNTFGLAIWARSVEFPMPLSVGFCEHVATLTVETIPAATGHRYELVGIEWPKREED